MKANRTRGDTLMCEMRNHGRDSERKNNKNDFFWMQVSKFPFHSMYTFLSFSIFITPDYLTIYHSRTGIAHTCRTSR